jgi:hypothetical protein
MAAEELAIADDALALRTDVDEDLVLVDPDDGAFDDVTVLEALDIGFLLREQLLHRGRLGAEITRRSGRLRRRLVGFRLGSSWRLSNSWRLGNGRFVSRGLSGIGLFGLRLSSGLRHGGRLGWRVRGGCSLAVSASAASAGAAVAAASSLSETAGADASAAGASGVSVEAAPFALASVGVSLSAAGVSLGSSATAIAPAGRSDASLSTVAAASVVGVVPPCCSSVNVGVSPVVGFAPRITNGLSAAQAGSEDPFGCGPW